MKITLLNPAFWLKVMRISSIQILLLLIFAGMSLAADIEAQVLEKRVSLHVEEQEIGKTLREIEKQAAVKFVFSPQVIRAGQKINVRSRQEKLGELLDKMLAPLGISYEVSGKYILLSDERKTTGVSAETEVPAPVVFLDRVIRGKVTGESGEALPGVNIILKGTQRGTTSAVDGSFELTVPDGENHILIFSFVGYLSQEIEVGNRTVVEVDLKEDEKSLEEVVVVGYGTQKKSDLTGAVSQIKGDLVAERNTIQLSQALQGTVSGVMVTRTGSEPNSTSTIRIRGITTMGTSDPLVIIDGVPGSLNRVSPSDVESISVLKDAASASMYGARAAAGVILVTTKRAGKGRLSFDYNYEFGIEKLSKMPPQESDAQTSMRVYNESTWNDNGNNPQFEYTMFSKDLIDNYPRLNREDPDRYPITDWYGLMLRKNAPRQSHNINLTAGGEYIQTKAAIDYSKIQGIYPNRSFERVTFRVNNDFNINSKLSALVDINGIYGLNNRPHTIVTPNTIPPGIYYPAVWSDGRIGEGLAGVNPYAQLTEGGFVKNTESSLSGRVGMDFKPLPGLKLSAMFSPTFSFLSDKSFLKRVPYTTFDNPDYIMGYIQGHTVTNLSEGRNESVSHVTQLLANYSREFDNHKIETTLGYENYYSTSQGISATRNNYILSTFPYLNLGNANFQFNSGSASELAYRSWFGRAIYSFKSRYSLQVNGRSDASSRFARDYRLAFFPSVSAGWIVSDETFMANAPWLSFLKVRASWGMLGNERIGDNYPYQSTIGFSTSSVYRGNTPISLQAARVNRYAIPDISWETTESYDLGLDISFLNNRLNVVFDYYKKATRDMLIELEIPKYIGLANPNQNAGKMHTRGWEFEAGWNDRIGKLSYGVSFNLSDSRSIMGDLKGTQFIGNQVKLEGSEFNEWYGYRTAGLFQTQDEVDSYPTINANIRPGDLKLLDISGPDGIPDGRISPEYDRTLLGGSLPRYLYGGNIKLGYKNIDFSVFVQGVGFQNAELPVRWHLPFTRIPQLIEGKYWSHYNTTEQNEKARYPRVSGNYTQNNYSSISDFWLFNGGYFRLKNIAVGYTIPQLSGKLSSIKKVRFYATGSDIFSISKYPKDRDPEGISNFVTSSYVFGALVTF